MTALAAAGCGVLFACCGVLGGEPHAAGTSAGTTGGQAGSAVTTSHPLGSRAPGSRWVPVPDTTWQWQLSTPVDTAVGTQVFDIDSVANGADIVRDLHARGRKVVCYVNAGAAEDFRPDYTAFPPQLLGNGGRMAW